MSKFEIQSVPLLIAPEATTEQLATDAACFTSVIEDLIGFGIQEATDTDASQLLIAAKYLASIAYAFSAEIADRAERQARE